MQMFSPLTQAECCLCGATEELTGEHKIKASAIRSIFGKDATYIGHFDGTSEPRIAQGPKSKALHFGARLCKPCNGARTQASDRAFDRFHALVFAKLEAGADDLYPTDDFAADAQGTLDLFRFFAKQLCLQTADAGGPRLNGVMLFALGLVDVNPIQLTIERDPTYQDFIDLSGEDLGFASHGGLVVVHNRAGDVTGFHSTLTLGPVQYIYRVESLEPVSEELSLVAPNFHARTKEAFREAMINPMTDPRRRQLGFAPLREDTAWPS